MEDKRDNCEVVASSLAAVLRQSLNAPFRRECFLLLGVTNIRDAEEKINALLKWRETEKGNSKKSVGMQEPVTIEDVQQCFGQKVDKPLEHSDAGLTHCTANFSETDSSTTVKLDLAPKVVDTWQKQITEVTDTHSDDESQLDWDVEPIGPK